MASPIKHYKQNLKLPIVVEAKKTDLASILFLVYELYRGRITVMMTSSKKLTCHTYNFHVKFNLFTLDRTEYGPNPIFFYSYRFVKSDWLSLRMMDLYMHTNQVFDKKILWKALVTKYCRREQNCISKIAWVAPEL